MHPSVRRKNVPELIAWIKANPDKASYASSGPGCSLHMAAELFMNMSKTKMQHVPYKGSSAAHPGSDRRAARSMIFDTVSAIRAAREVGHRSRPRRHDARALQRSSELPTIAESGLPGYDASTWGGILAPAGTPKDAVARLNTAINAALKMDDVRARLIGVGIEIQGGTPEQFGAVDPRTKSTSGAASSGRPASSRNSRVSFALR